MSVWLTIPSARPPEEAEKVLKLWRAQGYKIALFRDPGKSVGMAQTFNLGCDGTCDINDEPRFPNGYPGYAQAVNHLIELVMAEDPQAEWFVIGGDDVEPDMAHTAEEIAQQTAAHFGKTTAWSKRDIVGVGAHSGWIGERNELVQESTFGVMQPTGDRFAEGSIDRICGSAWLGREFCRRINQGKGPLWPEYVHNFVDEELQAVAKKYGIFQQRRDLIHLHRHFQRESDRLNSPAVARQVPAHLKHAFSPEGWEPYKKIFDTRAKLGFPGSEPIA